MPSVHVVKPGECLASIASRYGFAHYRMIYDHASNEALRALRPNPHVLLPGDTVAIPDPKEKTLTADTGHVHTFAVKRSRVFLRLDVLGSVAGNGVQALYELLIENTTEPIRGSIGADGKLDVEIPPTAHSGQLTLRDPETDDVLDVIDVRMGGLDPETTVSGLRSRLRRLGFDCGSEHGAMGPLTKEALAQFRRAYAIVEDDEMGPRTGAKLVELAGV